MGRQGGHATRACATRLQTSTTGAANPTTAIKAKPRTLSQPPPSTNNQPLTPANRQLLSPSTLGITFIMMVPQLSASILALATALPLSAGFVPTSGARSFGTKMLPAQASTTTTAAITMAVKTSPTFKWVSVLPLDEAPTPGTTKAVFVADLDLCVAADAQGLLFVLGNKCPPTNQPLTFGTVTGNYLKDPVLGTKVDIETGEALEWCPSLLGKLLRPILGPKPDGPVVPTFKVRSAKGNLEVFIDVNARAAYESKYWTGILDAQGKADGGYF